MTSPQDSSKTPKALVFWIIWFAILNGLVMIQIFVGGGFPNGVDQGKPPAEMLAVAAGLGLAAMAIRFVWLPKIAELGKKLPVMIVGLALSEAIGLLGIFAIGKPFPETQMALFVVAVGCIIAFIPFYAKPPTGSGLLQ